MSTDDLPPLADEISADPDPNPSWVNTNDTKNNNDIYFTSRCNPIRMGNSAPIAFGGCIVAIAVNAAFQTLPQSSSSSSSNFHLYSVLGGFHGPTRTDRKINCTVTPTRNTKTFATRRVVASQTLDDGSNTQRTCVDLFIDFHIAEPASLLVYDAQPSNPTWLSDGPTHPTTTLDNEDVLSNLVSNNHITPKQASAYKVMFHASTNYLSLRHCLSGVSSINLMGIAPHLPTPQDHLSLPEKTSGEWIRVRQPANPLPTAHLNMTALSFFMDQALSFLPLNHDHKGFQHAGACSTLDFALRVFVPDVKMGEQWYLRERKSVKGGNARTYTEGRLWTEAGELVCSMTQACILRPPPPPPAKSKSAAIDDDGQAKNGKVKANM